MEQEQARLGRDGHLDLIGQLEPAAALERLLGQEDLDQALKLVAIDVGQARVEAHVPLDDLQPGRWKRRRPQPLAPSLLEEAEHEVLREWGCGAEHGRSSNRSASAE